jgi:16S rRNA (cytosine967-C5)-methyltransferase
MLTARDHVIDIIDRYYSTSSDLKSIQNKQFSKYKISAIERNRIYVLTREILRWKGRIDWYIKKHLNSPFNKLQTKLLVILEIGTYELLFDDQVPDYAAINSAVELAKQKLNRKASGLVNAVLRKISTVDSSKKQDEMTDFRWYSFPDWLYNKWLKQFGEQQTKELCKYLNGTLPLMIRRNSKKIDHDDFFKKIPKEVAIELIENSDRFYEVVDGGSFLRTIDSMERGNYSFQDRAAGMIVEVLDPQPDEIILDVCCAPGTKTNYISELMNNSGKIYASDVDINRIELAKKDSIRLGNSNIKFEQKDASKDKFPIADRILIDAPCTGTGTIGRRPDIKWRRKPHHLINIVKMQQSILKNVHKFVKPGGILVYATCSIEEEENWQVVEAFLKLNTDFKVGSAHNSQLTKFFDDKGALNTLPHIHKMDGMFAVKMIKNEK